MKKNSYRFIFYCTLAFLFHYTTVLYIILLLANLQNKSLLLKPIVCFTLCFVLFSFLLGKRIDISIFQNLLMGHGSEMSRYATISRFGWMYGLVFQLSMILICNLNRLCYNKQPLAQYSGNKVYSNLDKIMWINIVALLFVPLYMINTQIMRMVRGLLYVDYAFCGYTITHILSLNERFKLVLIYVLWTILYGFMYVALAVGNTHSVYFPFFFNNAFFDLIE